MKKAGMRQIYTRNELKPPLWLALAQLLFAAVLLYVIRNPIQIATLSKSTQLSESKPAIVITIPMTTAVAAPAALKIQDLPM